MIGVGVLGLIGVVAVLTAIAGVHEIVGAQPAQFSTVRGTVDSYEYLPPSCPTRICFWYDILQPLRDYQLTIREEASETSQEFVVHPYDFNRLPELSALVGVTVSLTIGTDSTWSDALDANIREVLAISVSGSMYSTPYALHPKLRYWDWIATGIAWIAPPVAYAVVLLPLPARKTRRWDSSDDPESQWSAYAIVSSGTWFVVGLVGGYFLRVRAGSVEFWLLLYGFAAVPAVLATMLNLLEKRVGLLLPRTLATKVVDYSATYFSPADVYRISMALGLTGVLEISAVLLVRQTLVTILA